MKKIYSLLLIALLIPQVHSQNDYWDDVPFMPQYYGCDTLFPGDREPTFYYWDTIWWDKYIANPTSDKQYFRPDCLNNTGGCKPEFARYCYTDTSLRVIGIAAAVRLICYAYWADTVDPWTFTYPEYLNLYEVDTATDSMIFLAGKSYNNIKPRYLIQNYYSPKYLGAADSNDFNPIVEVYFDSAITVHDSFYVSATGNNIFYENRTNPFWEIYLVGINGYSDYMGTHIMPDITHFRRRVHRIPADQDEDYGWMGFEATDTNWHTYGHTGIVYGQLGPVFFTFPFIFPIIDTSRYVVDTSCERPTDLGVMSLSPGMALLSWYDPNGSRWELSVAPEGSSVEGGTKTQWDNTVATLDGLEQGQWYFAWVRTLCDSTHSSPWSERLRFYVPADTTGPEIVITPENIVDKNTHLMPNPATDHLTVVSSFRISTVEVWSLSGKLALRHKVDAMSASIDVSSLPKGHYIVRIATNNGLTHKKLVVE